MSERAVHEQTLPPKLDLNVGAKSHIFQPPRTPSASTSLYRSTSFLTASATGLNGSITRKRTRTDFDQDADSPRRNGDWASDSIQSSGLETPVNLVNTRYELSGGLDTPSATAVAAYERENGDSNYLDIMDRRWAGRGQERFISQTASLPPESNGRGRHSTEKQSDSGWGQSVFSIVGDVAGRVWEFGTSAFKGFYAGGGAGYQITPRPSTLPDQNTWHNVPARSSSGNTPVPGEFPDEDYIPDYMSSPRLGYPAKRIYREASAQKDRWIMVPRSASTPYSRGSSPLQTTSVRRTPASNARRPTRSGKRTTRTSMAGSPALASNRPASFASPRSTVSTPTTKNASPVAIEAQRYAARRRREEKEAEESIQRFNAQLKAMIREGKQALGTRFEIDEEMDESTDEIVVQMEDVDEGIQINDVYERRKRRR
jgi:hypothetical protein